MGGSQPQGSIAQAETKQNNFHRRKGAQKHLAYNKGSTPDNNGKKSQQMAAQGTVHNLPSHTINANKHTFFCPCCQEKPPAADPKQPTPALFVKIDKKEIWKTNIFLPFNALKRIDKKQK
jgi:hypothetical protein